MATYEEDLLIKNAKLFIAVRENRDVEEKKEIILNCLNEGAELNKRFGNDNYNTALHMSITKGDIELVKFLLDKGANKTLKNNNGKTAIDVARELNSKAGQAMVEILESYGKDTTAINAEMDAEFIQQNKELTYKKRNGTSGVSGQLYETKLLSLVLLRALTNEKIDQFHLGTNVDGIGALDDICIRYKEDGHDIALFLQAKHKSDTKKGQITVQDLWKTSGDFSLLKYFDSYSKIRQSFKINNTNCMFNGRFEDVKCHFVLYTTVNHNLFNRKRSDNILTDTVNSLINTGNNSDIFKYEYHEDEINLLTNTILVQRMKELGNKFIQLIQEKRYQSMMSDETIRSFHVVLAHQVINLSEVQNDGYRIGTFSDDFLSCNDELLTVLRETMFTEAVKTTNLKVEEIDSFILALHKTSAESISKLIGHILYYDKQNNRLHIDENKIKDTTYGKYLLELQVSHSIMKEAYKIACKNKLCSLKFKLPATFGNSDLTLKKNKADKRLKFLANKLCQIINNSKSKNIVLDESIVGPNKLIESGFLDINGGLGSAVGNLLIMDANTYQHKFNMNSELLGERANKLLTLLKKDIKDLEDYRLNINIYGFPRLSLYPYDYEKNYAKDFLNNLWFYTHQAKENDIEDIARNEILTHCRKKILSTSGFDINAHVIFIKIHDAVQKWWMLEDEAYYLTKDIFFWDHILTVFINSPLLSILNFIYTSHVKKYNMEFSSDTIKSLCLDKIVSNITMIVTDIITLSGAKLVQYYKEHNNYKFIDFDYLLSLPPNFLATALMEIKSTNDILLIMYENKAKNKALDKLKNFICECRDNKIIIVTTKILEMELEEQIISKGVMNVKDVRNDLTNFTIKTQQSILENCFIFQGKKVKFISILDSEARRLIKGEILLKICNKEEIKIGDTLSCSRYDEIKAYYVHRSLIKNKKLSHDSDEETYYYSLSSSDDESTRLQTNLFPLYSHYYGTKKPLKIETLEDIKGTVIILAAPGMGKSTLLTHLSIETKKKNPSIWIERINLLEHTRRFRKWKQEKTIVDMKEALKFICETAVNKTYFNKQNSQRSNNYEDEFEIDVIDNKVVLKKFDKGRDLNALELEIFIYLYNKGNVILLFDGFDEICPHYKKEITDMLKCITNSKYDAATNDDASHISQSRKAKSKQRLWITSRSYNNIRKTLESQFGTSYTLRPFSRAEQKLYLEKYFNIYLNLGELNIHQFNNIDELIKYMSEYRQRHGHSPMKIVKSIGVTLHHIYVAAIEYFQNEIKHIPLTPDKSEFRQKWNLNTSSLTIFNRFLGNPYELNAAMELAGTPLHVSIAADYLQHQIKDVTSPPDNISKGWDLDSNTFAFYARFLDTKLRNIRFEDKNQMDTSNPDIQITYEKELKEFIEKHKILAFYALFKNNLGELLTDQDIKNVKDILQGIELGIEKSGLVECVINSVPKFVHLVFAEYFAIEFVTDYIKRAGNIEEQVVVWTFILNNLMFRSSKGVLDVFDHKIKTDNELSSMDLNVEIRNYIFDELTAQNMDPCPLEAYYGDDEDLMYSDTSTDTALDKAMANGLRYVTILLLKAIVEIVDKNNLDTFIDILTKRETFLSSILTLGYTELLETILDTIRKVDAFKLQLIFKNRYTSLTEISDCCNEDIINDLKSQAGHGLSEYFGSIFDY